MYTYLFAVQELVFPRSIDKHGEFEGIAGKGRYRPEPSAKHGEVQHYREGRGRSCRERLVGPR